MKPAGARMAGDQPDAIVVDAEYLLPAQKGITVGLQ